MGHFPHRIQLIEVFFKSEEQYLLPKRDFPIDTQMAFKEAKEYWLEIFERCYLSAVFAENNYTISKAADQAGINRNLFSRLLEKHGILTKNYDK